jgi:hypothetical protein
MLPLWVLMIIYAIYDPFKVLYSYEVYNQNYEKTVPLNRDYVSTEYFKKNCSKYNYDSFIFGSSKALAFLCRDFCDYVKGSCFHYDSNGESLYGILAKLEYMDKKGADIKNCILALDSAILCNTENSKGHLYIKHPDISNESNISFQFEFVKAFLSNKFFIPYIALKLNKEIPKFFEYRSIIDVRAFSYDYTTNDIFFSYAEDVMKQDIDSYYKNYAHVFYQRDSTNERTASSVISEKGKLQLEQIRKLFDKHKTNYKIVLYPNYNQMKLNPADLKILENAFGNTNVYDYTGINSITNQLKNYYENDHCRPLVGKKIMTEIYK